MSSKRWSVWEGSMTFRRPSASIRGRSSKDLDLWAYTRGVVLDFSRPGKPTDNAFIESFNGKLRDELLNGEIFETLLEAKVLIERWRREYNTLRPHSALGYRPPAPESRPPHKSTSATLQRPCAAALLTTEPLT